MPFVNIRITDEQVRLDQKDALVKRVTQALVDILNKEPETTFIVIDEIATDNWGIGGRLVSDIRQSSS